MYAELCSSCHGPTLAGGQAPSLLDDTWNFGGDDESIAQSIRDGRPSTAMPPFKAALSEQEIRALVIYIREERERAERDPTTAGARRGAPAPLPKGTLQSERHAFKIELVADGLDNPWGIAWLPDGRMLVTERPGRLRIIERDRLLVEPIAGVPPVWEEQDGGLMDVEAHPQFAANGWIYLSFSEEGRTPGTSATRIIRARLRENRLVDQKTLFQPSPELYWEDNTHFGSRFLFDQRGHLFYSIGDRGHDGDAQELSSPYGKLHRVDDEGRPADGNPFADRPGALASIWSYGHRNQQGLAFHPITGDLWAAEHGPRGGDELNRVERGRNYGWPTITYGMNYDGTPITDRTTQDGMEQPVVQWTPSIAVCAIAFYTGDRFPRWRHDMFATALAHQELRRIRIEGGTVVHQEVLFKGLGRVRDVATGPDGYLYVALNMPGRIVRLVPSQ
ncbi:MAG: glucose sorbosone dehydrogenase [Luteitalea sp.]|nr:glucose sorbosone dehydrogenase [Luteitalea sp.]